mmetsp:Transcript_29026/g.43855  ORF Transcript_29026/g.43855 Transcript_29026/m.43855 type:complete len:105 (+) Transcript_29026:93-407(+)|eukprot:CAMPEP_0178898174 /NCGR_PEP_ID=MMETSP0786-20121207/2177_1 /TAXON_ID=186022 /ORGANISM="Thalassionema frauenfeldii, Strain CCMP 1798" /LENGTH=104 /DNA_ID=CAMNT_0020568849 /DNA_START=25 /DNA_END=339 /DNA_ORIENTATION=+
MALSMVNYFVWEMKEALVPFLVADIAVLATLSYVEKGMKAQRARRELAEKEAYNKKHEDDKTTIAAIKKAQRDEQKREQYKMKGSSKRSGGQTNPQINQPDKCK